MRKLHVTYQRPPQVGVTATRHNYRVKLGQLAEALIRLARVVVGIKLHTEDMSVEQGMRFPCIGQLPHASADGDAGVKRGEGAHKKFAKNGRVKGKNHGRAGRRCRLV